MRVVRDATVVLCQAAVVVFSLTAALAIRLDFDIPKHDWDLLTTALLVVVPLKLLIFFLGGLHKGSWRYASLPDVARIGFGRVIAWLLAGTILTIWSDGKFARSASTIDYLLCFPRLAPCRYSL